MRFRISACAAALLFLTAVLAAQSPGTPRVTYARSFKGSVPAFLQIKVSKDGHATYQAREKSGQPLSKLSFTASPAALGKIFAAAKALDDFSGTKIQSKQSVAYTGDKMLAYDDAGHHAAQQFTYTTDKHAAALVKLFEAISVTGMDAIRLQRALRYQPLDVFQIMNQIQSDWSAHQMAEPQLLQPILQSALANTSVMNAAKKRARKLLQEFAKSGTAT